MTRSAAFVCLGALAFVEGFSPSAAAAQAGEFQPPAWVEEGAFLGIDALIGGLTAGAFQRLRGVSFQDGFTRGSLGGATSYAGRRLGASSFAGAGLLGREVSAVGASVARNAAGARPSLERVLLPIGPVHLYVSGSASPHVHAKLNLRSAAWTVAAALRPELRFDPGRSLSAGAPVFYAPGRWLLSAGQMVNGLMVGGNVVLSGAGNQPGENTFAHERVHVLQQDFHFYTWGDPLEGAVVRRTRIGARLYRYFDFGYLAPVAVGGFYHLAGVKHDDRLREIEAEFLERR